MLVDGPEDYRCHAELGLAAVELGTIAAIVEKRFATGEYQR